MAELEDKVEVYIYIHLYIMFVHINMEVEGLVPTKIGTLLQANGYLKEGEGFNIVGR